MVYQGHHQYQPNLDRGPAQADLAYSQFPASQPQAAVVAQDPATAVHNHRAPPSQAAPVPQQGQYYLNQ